MVEIKDYQPGDEKPILELFKLAFKSELPYAFWKWRFLDNPTRIQAVKLAWDHEILVGHYAVSPVKIINDEKELLGALSMTTMTHPHYSGKGIFKMLAEETYRDIALQHDCVLIYGFPNSQSHYGFIKNLAWNDLFEIPQFTLTTGNQNDGDIDFDISEIKIFQPEHIIPFNKWRKEYKNHISINEEYLNWRYIKHPTNKYRCFMLTSMDNEKSIVITKCFNNTFTGTQEIDILDWAVAANEIALRSIIKLIINQYSDTEISKINCWLPLGDSRHIILEKIGFLQSTPITYMGVRILNDQYSFADPSGWYYTMGDSDVY